MDISRLLLLFTPVAMSAALALYARHITKDRKHREDHRHGP